VSLDILVSSSNHCIVMKQISRSDATRASVVGLTGLIWLERHNCLNQVEFERLHVIRQNCHFVFAN
jgi:hypothetical protein